jgi:hypothetical protein
LTIGQETIENEREDCEEIPFADFKPRLVADQSEIEKDVKGHASESRRQNRYPELAKVCAGSEYRLPLGDYTSPSFADRCPGG